MSYASSPDDNYRVAGEYTGLGGQRPEVTNCSKHSRRRASSLSKDGARRMAVNFARFLELRESLVAVRALAALNRAGFSSPPGCRGMKKIPA